MLVPIILGGWFATSMAQLHNGTASLHELRKHGLTIFTTAFTPADGYGDGPFAGDGPPTQPGHRPTLQGNGLTLHVNGLDAQSCNECHFIVKQSLSPPALGIGGVGGLAQNTIISPSLIDVSDSADDRVIHIPGHTPDMPMVFDGIADFNGRLSNPPFLFGGGGIELLAKEMTTDLQTLLHRARTAPVGTVTLLHTHGVSFGSITTLAGGGVDLTNIEGIGFADNTGRQPEEVLVVRPFGRKGEKFSMRDFGRAAMQFHFGMQPVEVVGLHIDADGDGVVNEVTVEDMTALHVFGVTNPVPVMEQLDDFSTRGLFLFSTIGCAGCHVPTMKTRSRYLPLAFPEIPSEPFQNVYLRIDLADAGFAPVPGEDGVFVPLFADLKRHDMGDGLTETFESAEISNREFTTARLWGMADTAPYLHDGRATTLIDAIAAHGGDAQRARDYFLSLPADDQAHLIAFLNRLRTPTKPNEDLLLTTRRP